MENPIFDTVIKLDSINISIIEYENYVETKSLFVNSGSSLDIKYYFVNKNKNVFLWVDIKEPSLKTVNTDAMYSSYYYKNNELLCFSFGWISVIPGIPKPDYDDRFDIFGYNRTFTDDFLQNYSILLYEKILTLDDY